MKRKRGKINLNLSSRALKDRVRIEITLFLFYFFDFIWKDKNRFLTDKSQSLRAGRIQLSIFQEIRYFELVSLVGGFGHRLIMVYSERETVANGEYDSSSQECCVSILKIIMQASSSCNRLITESEPLVNSG